MLKDAGCNLERQTAGRVYRRTANFVRLLFLALLAFFFYDYGGIASFHSLLLLQSKMNSEFH